MEQLDELILQLQICSKRRCGTTYLLGATCLIGGAARAWAESQDFFWSGADVPCGWWGGGEVRGLIGLKSGSKEGDQERLWEGRDPDVPLQEGPVIPHLPPQLPPGSNARNNIQGADDTREFGGDCNEEGEEVVISYCMPLLALCLVIVLAASFVLVKHVDLALDITLRALLKFT
jgi:hypothetical protein